MKVKLLEKQYNFIKSVDMDTDFDAKFMPNSTVILITSNQFTTSHTEIDTDYEWAFTESAYEVIEE